MLKEILIAAGVMVGAAIMGPPLVLFVVAVLIDVASLFT